MRLRPLVTSGVAAGAATALAVVTSATAFAAPAKDHSTAPKHPVASLTVSTTRPAVGAKVVANASKSKLPKGDRLRRAQVAVGDHTRPLGLQTLRSRVAHAYAKPGTYTVVLTIVDKHGVKVTKAKKVTVAPSVTSGAMRQNSGAREGVGRSPAASESSWMGASIMRLPR